VLVIRDVIENCAANNLLRCRSVRFGFGANRGPLNRGFQKNVEEKVVFSQLRSKLYVCAGPILESRSGGPSDQPSTPNYLAQFGTHDDVFAHFMTTRLLYDL
jgi:hypothetical protein